MHVTLSEITATQKIHDLSRTFFETMCGSKHLFLEGEGGFLRRRHS